MVLFYFILIINSLNILHRIILVACRIVVGTETKRLFDDIRTPEKSFITKQYIIKGNYIPQNTPQYLGLNNTQLCDIYFLVHYILIYDVKSIFIVGTFSAL